MDPSENIKRQRELAQEILTLNQSGGSDAPDDDTVDRLIGSAAELAELVIALHEWRLKGGYDPYEADGEGGASHLSGESPDPDWMNP